MTIITDKFILESFKQAKENCASVAVLKAAIIRHGLRNVFIVSDYRNGKMTITFRNKKTVRLSLREISEINKKNGLLFRHYRQADKKRLLAELRLYVEFCFAAMVKTMVKYGFNGDPYTIDEAIRELRKKGINSDYSWRLLGLPKPAKIHDLEPSHLSALQKKKAVVLYNDYHAVVLAAGWWDDYGSAVRLGRQVPLLNKEEAAYWYELK